MRYDAEHKQKTRERVLKEAAKAIRAEGPHRVAVAGVMAKAGLTHGGFYGHFQSKDDLIAASIEEMFRQSSKRFQGETEGLPAAVGRAAYIDFYLSPEHRDARGQGCPLPYLSADAPRLSPQSREAFAGGVARLTERLAALLEAVEWLDPTASASSLLAECVGALALARAEPDADRSDAILRRSRDALKARFHLETLS